MAIGATLFDDGIVVLDWLVISQLDHLVLVVSHIDVSRPVEVLVADQRAVKGHFDTLVTDGGDVLEERAEARST